MIDFVAAIVIILLGNSFISVFKDSLRPGDVTLLQKLWGFHLLFGMIYYAFIVYGPGGDSIGYYNASNLLTLSQAWELFLVYGPGTYGMYLLNVIPSSFLGFFGMTLVYTLLGFIAFIMYYVLFGQLIAHNSSFMNFKLFPFVLFLPNLHFWSAGLGKDTILFFCIACFLYGLRNLTRRLPLVLFALALSYLVRPHITIFLIAAFGLGYMLDGNLKLYQKFFLSLIFLVGFIALFDNVMTFLKIEDLSSDTLNEFSESRVSNLSRASTGSSVDISSYPFPLKVLTFLYRPFFFDINGVLAVIASFENLLLLLLSIKLFKANPYKVFVSGNYFIKGAFLFLIMGVVSFSLILGNLGIMLRQKNMFLPILIFLCMYAISYQKERSQGNQLIND